MIAGKRGWTLEETSLLRKEAGGRKSLREVWKSFPGRSLESLKKKSFAMGLQFENRACLLDTIGGGLKASVEKPPSSLGSCQWPVSRDRPWRFCGDPLDHPSSPYCSAHLALSKSSRSLES